MSKSRFTIKLTISDNYGELNVGMASPCDEALTISSRAVMEWRMKPLAGVPLVSFDQAVHMLKTKAMRKDTLIAIAKQLAARLAERMEDAEGWHDESRIEPARDSIDYRP